MRPPCVSPESIRRTMWGWWSSAQTRISRRKRASWRSRLGASAPWRGRSTLRATCCPVFSWIARNTSPKPPAPRCFSIRYCPPKISPSSCGVTPAAARGADPPSISISSSPPPWVVGPFDFMRHQYRGARAAEEAGQGSRPTDHPRTQPFDEVAIAARWHAGEGQRELVQGGARAGVREGPPVFHRAVLVHQGAHARHGAGGDLRPGRAEELAQPASILDGRLRQQMD